MPMMTCRMDGSSSSGGRAWVTTGLNAWTWKRGGCGGGGGGSVVVEAKGKSDDDADDDGDGSEGVVMKERGGGGNDGGIEVIAEQPKFVCRAGLKLEEALAHFDVDVTGCVALDSGLSTGGFTDCLLQSGAKKVYGVDVGYGQVAEKIRQDERVVIMERTNLRYVTELPDAIDIVTLDLSFISVLKVLPAICRILKPGGTMLVLSTLITPRPR